MVAVIAIAEKTEIRALTADEGDKLKPLFLALCKEDDVVGDADLFTQLLPWHIPHYRVFVVDADGPIVGFVDALPVATCTAPYLIGMCQYCYVLPSYRCKSGLLCRAMIRYFQRIGIDRVQIVAKRTASFWQHHHFQPILLQLERRI